MSVLDAAQTLRLLPEQSVTVIGAVAAMVLAVDVVMAVVDAMVFKAMVVKAMMLSRNPCRSH